ncbi:hypothetical protein V8E53_013595 [Lactarius tabidus]
MAVPSPNNYALRSRGYGPRPAARMISPLPPTPTTAAAIVSHTSQSALNQEIEEPYLFDGAGHIFSMYLEMAAEDDKKMTEAWTAGADSILIFTGLFSAAVATLISVTIQDVYPNSQDTANFYLANIYQLLADPNRSNFSLPSSPPTFSPPTYAVWVNSLWLLSLVISLTCALLATLLQQWARKYNTVTQPRLGAHMRVSMHAFFSHGVEKFLLPWAVEALPTLLHISLYLFFSGLLVFLWNINLTMFRLVLAWVSICTVLYGCFTFMPIICPDSPYHTPLSSLTWFVVTGIPYVTLRAIRWVGKQFSSQAADGCLRDLEIEYGKFLSRGMLKTAEKTARSLPSEVDTRTFMRTFESLNDDNDLERFFAGLPGFRDSRVVRTNPLLRLTGPQKLRLSKELTEFMDRTLSSDSLSDSDKNRRAIICAKAIDPAHFPGAFQWMLDKILSENQYTSLLTPEIGLIVETWDNSGDRRTDYLVKAMVSGIIARAQRSNDRWFTLASNALGVRKSVLRDYAAQGNNLSLAILTHVTRRNFYFIREQYWQSKFSFILETATGFNVRDTSPQLQHEFCALWNEVVRQAKADNSRLIPEYILRRIRKVYIALHENTDAAPTGFSSLTSGDDSVLLEPSSYEVCKVPGHRPDLATIHEDIVLSTFAPDFALGVYAGSSSSATTQVPSNTRPMDVLPADSSIPAPITAPAPSQPVHQIPAGGSPHSAAAGATQVNDTDRTVAHSTTERTTASHLLSSNPPPGTVGHQLNADPRASSSDGSHIPSSPPIPVHNDIPLARSQLTSDPHTTQSDRVPSRPGSKPVIPATAPPPQSRSEPERSAVVEGESSVKAAIRKDNDASGSSSLPTPPSEDIVKPGYQTLHALQDEFTGKK